MRKLITYEGPGKTKLVWDVFMPNDLRNKWCKFFQGMFLFHNLTFPKSLNLVPKYCVHMWTLLWLNSQMAPCRTTELWHISDGRRRTVCTAPDRFPWYSQHYQRQRVWVQCSNLSTHVFETVWKWIIRDFFSTASKNQYMSIYTVTLRLTMEKMTRQRSEINVTI